MKRLMSILVIAAMLVAAVNVHISASAVKVKKPSKVSIKSIQTVSTNAIRLSWKKVKKAKGYQIKLAANKNLTKGKKTININKNKKAKTIKDLKSGTKYYVKVRAYTKRSGKKIYGKWSKIKSAYTKQKKVKKIKKKNKGPHALPETVEDYEPGYIPDSNYVEQEPTTQPTTSSDSETFKSKYTYETEVLNKYNLYTGHTVFIYVKTVFPYWGDYPDGTETNIRALSDENIIVATHYSDVNYLSNIFQSCIPVNGGYLVQKRFNTPGKHIITIQEQTKPGINDWCNVCNIEVEVKDYDSDLKSWAEKVLSEQTDNSMTSLEKLQVMEHYLEENFKYSPNDGNNNAIYLISTTGAGFETHRIDCLDATRFMLLFAELLGLNGESTYAGYLNHHYATIYIDGKAYAFDPSVLPKTGIVTEWEYIV